MTPSIKKTIFPGIILVLLLSATGCKNAGQVKNEAVQPSSQPDLKELAQTPPMDGTAGILSGKTSVNR
jgi:hypothetical protein